MVESITVQALHDMMTVHNVVVLDVRAEAAYKDWHIEHINLQSLNIQTSKLIANGPAAYPAIPKDQTVVVVCAKGNASKDAAAILNEHGYQAVSLTGGMGAWSAFYHPVTIAQDENLELIQIIRPGKGCLSYMLISAGEAVVVDAARHTDVYVDLANRHNARIQYVLDTHCHADHISGGPELSAQSGSSYWIDAGEIGDSPLEFHGLVDNQSIRFGAATLKVMAVPTPGHTPGSTSFLVNDKYLLSGDTVFVSGLGRPDLGGKAKEWAKMLYETVQTKLSRINEDVLVLPAHFSNVAEITDAGYVGATLASIRNQNELLQGVTEDTFTTQIVGAAATATPPNYLTIVQVNRGLLAPVGEELSDLEVGPNRCAAKHLA